MLSQRLVTGSLLGVLAVGVFYFDTWFERAAVQAGLPVGGLLMLLLIALVVPAAAELAGLLRHKAIPANGMLLAGTATALGVTLWVGHGCELGAAAVGSVLIAKLAATIIWHCRKAEPEGALAAAGGGVLVMAYLGIGGGMLMAIRQEHAAWVVLSVLLITKSCDIGAYFTGRAVGRHRLIPWLSPGKTWEGLAGGVALSIVVAVALAYLSQVTGLGAVYREVEGEVVAVVQRYHLGWAVLVGFALAVVGHAGDLVMSLFKRDAGVKDSGATLPGFGGVLDLIDSPLLVAPLAYWLLKLAAI